MDSPSWRSDLWNHCCRGQFWQYQRYYCWNCLDTNWIVHDLLLPRGFLSLFVSLAGCDRELMFRAKYFGFWQTDLSKLIHTLQHITLYALIALAIASGVEGSNYTDPSSVSIGQKLAQAYSILCTSPVSTLTNYSHYLLDSQCIPMGRLVATRKYRCWWGMFTWFF